MATCSRKDSDGFLVVTNASPASCTGYIVLSPTEYQQFSQLLASQATQPTQPTSGLETISASDAASVFGAGFSIVMVCFVVARGVGTILDLIRRG